MAPTQAIRMQPGTRYLCLTCEPMGDIFASDKDEPECPHGATHYVMHMSVKECAACGDWCDEQDVDIFLARHRCPAAEVGKEAS